MAITRRTLFKGLIASVLVAMIPVKFIPTETTPVYGTTNDFVFSFEDFRKTMAEPAMKELANRLDNDALKMYDNNRRNGSGLEVLV